MKIRTGKGTIPLMSLVAILSISLVVNLPGLAISPMLGELGHIFPNTSQLEIQMLTILPNLLIIPFILLSGRLSVSGNKITMVVIALSIYLACAILYLFAHSMTQLIIISSLLGVGCGLTIPLAAGLITDLFTGKYRIRQLGLKSGLANLALVGATLLVGLMPQSNWHLPFVVYLIPIIPLALAPFMKTASTMQPAPTTQNHGGKVLYGRISGLIGLYFFITFAVVIVAYYLPFLTQTDQISSSKLGTITSMLYLGIFLPGFFLSWILKTLRNNTILIAMLAIAAGLTTTAIGANAYLMSLGTLLMGLGYGTIQPIIYDKAADCSTSPQRATMALSLVMATNYLAVTTTPFIIDVLRAHLAPNSNIFPFVLNIALSVGFAYFIYIYRNSFALRIEKSYYQ